MSVKLKVQSFGRFLSNMVMPNIGAFIAWGLITAFFIPTGWMPNDAIASMFVSPMLTYLLPLLIGFTGGKLVYGDRGGVVGSITTFGVIAGASMPMLLGAMIAGPLGGLVIKKFDKLVDGKIKSGFEMLVNNFSAGILGMILALIAYYVIGPTVEYLSDILKLGVELLVNNNLLPLTSIFVEPAKILFLNNAINHGIFTPLGTEQVALTGKSIFFLIEANPGPGFGLLLAYMFFGQGTAKNTASGAAIIQFFGGIHEIYFPYVLMNPRLIIAVILGGMAGVFTLTMFNAGLASAASPGSIIAILTVCPPDSIVGVLLSVTAATVVSFVISAILLKTSKTKASLEEAQSQSSAMKISNKVDVASNQVRKIVVACDAGMGSSAMGASLLKKKVNQANLDIEVKNLAINNLSDDIDVVVTHRDLSERAKKYAPNAVHISLDNFLDPKIYDDLVTQLQQSKQTRESNINTTQEDVKPNNQFSLTENTIFLDCKAQNKEEAIRFVGQQLVNQGFVKPDYIEAMLEREKLTPTYLGESIAIPHGTNEAKNSVLKTGMVFCQYRDGVQFTESEQDVAKIVVGIAARNDEHLQVIAKLANALSDEKTITDLINTNNKQTVLNILN